MIKNKTTVIAEVGVNHNNKINIATKLIDIAKSSGADYVKFQSYKTENIVLKRAKITLYQKKNLKRKITQFQMLKKLELSENKQKYLINYCKKKKNSIFI